MGVMLYPSCWNLCWTGYGYPILLFGTFLEGETIVTINNEVSKAPAVIRPFRQARTDLHVLNKRKAR